MILQIAEGGGVAMLSGKEMLIDAKHLRAWSAGPLGGQAPEKVLGVTFDGGAADPFPLGDTAAADAIPVIFEDFVAKGFCRVLARQHSSKPMAEPTAAILAEPVLACQNQPNALESPTGMPYPP